MRINLVRLAPENDPLRARDFDDAVLPFYYALARLGHRVEIVDNRLDPAALSLVFGANIDPARNWLRRGPRCVIINLEQFRLESANWGRDEAYQELLAKNEVWDYSAGNVAFLKNKGIEAGFFKFGYVPEMSRLADSGPGDVDALFYGALNERRLEIMEALGRAGICVKRLSGVYALERERYIQHSKMVLNIHSGRQATLEIIRLSYLLANRKAVVSELNADTEHYPELAQACAFFPYEKLVEGAAEFFSDARRLQAQAEAGFRAFSALSLVDELRPLVGRLQFFAGSVLAGEDGAQPAEENASDRRLDILDSPVTDGEDRSFLSGSWADWVTPEKGLPAEPDYRSQARWLLRLTLLKTRCKAWRYRRRLHSLTGDKKCWYLRKLDRLEYDIEKIGKILAASR
ncbi:MAG: hypothetical protein LBV79_01390 [Candidatus Adiutrix sp.]|jgi:hypothetical protein|nr:hypothetical protein [Candidatus Adiutrix sp.]